MLSGRHVHLHQALGLGPMWVSRAAQVVDVDIDNLLSAQETTPQTLTAPIIPATREAQITTTPPATSVSAITPDSKTIATPPTQASEIERKVSKRAAALLAHIAQAQQHRPVKTEIATADALVNTATVADYANDTLHTLQHKIMQCSACDLHSARRQAFAGEVREHCRLIVVLPHPSVQDDAAGSLLSGDVGEMWGKILKAMKLQADEVYTTTAIKCAPNIALVPKQHHAASCSAYLQRELQLLPEVPVLLLAENQRSLLQRLQEWTSKERVYSIPHPRKMQRNPDTKRAAWETLQSLMQHL